MEANHLKGLVRQLVSLFSYPHQQCCLDNLESNTLLAEPFVPYRTLCEVITQLTVMSWQEMFAKFQRFGGKIS